MHDKKSNFGIFLDSSPDRWGRLLMRRREAALARQEKRTEKLLLESDYLLGVYDGHRMGGIRFRMTEKGPFLNDNKKLAAPPWGSLRELEQASLQLEAADASEDPDYLKWLEMLIAPGSSLGGARPKASVLDKKGQLWIAKFPSRADGRDIGAWEMVAHDIAVASGVNMSEGMIKKFSGDHHTYLTKRFDRKGEVRLHFSSAMTLLGYSDGEDHESGASYLDLVEFIITHGAQVDRDLEELWRRIVLNISISNTDDHLRNHGFILTEKGWVLSPAYDLNPTDIATGLKLNISESDNSLDLELAREVAPYFRLKPHRAEEIIGQVQEASGKWRQLAKKYGITAREQEMMGRGVLNNPKRRV